jgi:hypothetical protein
VFEQLTLAQLLDRWRSELVAVGSVATEVWDEHPPAEAGNLDLAERRLGRSLPPTYREFLSASDGWPVSDGSVSGLRTAASVGWFRDIESDWYEIWREIAGDGPDGPGFDVELMARALVVSTPGDAALLLDPEDVDPETGEWACYTFSNWAAGASAVGRSFRDGLEHLYVCFVADHHVESPTLVEAGGVVEQAYQGMLGGDLTARALLDDWMQVSWRAWLLAAQFDAFGAQPFDSDLSDSVNSLWWGHLGAVTTEEALADRVLMDDLLPLYVVRLVETGRGADHEINRAPDPVAARMRTYVAQISAGTGLIADFSYTPQFAAGIDQARQFIAEDNLDAAWDLVLASLPTWTPMSPNHLAPLGLYYDRDLRRLLSPTQPNPPPSAPGRQYIVASMIAAANGREVSGPDAATVTALPNRKQYSDRTLAVLRTPYQPRSAP